MRVKVRVFVRQETQTNVSRVMELLSKHKASDIKSSTARHQRSEFVSGAEGVLRTQEAVGNFTKAVLRTTELKGSKIEIQEQLS